MNIKSFENTYRCPFCDSDDTWPNGSDYDEHSMYEHCRCDSCGREYTLVYNVVEVTWKD